MPVVTTSLVIEFDTGSSETQSIFTAEIDTREDGLNGGKSSFKPGDPIYILLYRSDDTEILNAITSHGSLTFNSTGSREETAFVEFINSDTSGLTYPVMAGKPFSGEWIGTADLGSVLVRNQSELYLPSPPADPYVGVYEYTYTTDYEVYLLSNTLISNKEKYEIVVYFKGQTTG